MFVNQMFMPVEEFIKQIMTNAWKNPIALALKIKRFYPVYVMVPSFTKISSFNECKELIFVTKIELAI